MKTTVDIADPIYREVKARAALKGQTVKAFIAEALTEKLETERLSAHDEPPWMRFFGVFSKDVVDEVQARIDAEFSAVDPDEWE